MVYLLLTFQTLDSNADESVSSERIQLKRLLHWLSNTELNIETVPNVYPVVHFVLCHVRPLSRDVRPAVTYRTVLYRHASRQPCVGRRGYESDSGPARLNTQL